MRHRSFAKSKLLQKELISNVSHELRTPVSILKAQLENLADGIDKPSSALFEQMVNTVDEMSDLIEFFLGLSRLQVNKQKLNLSSFSLGDYLEECVDKLTNLSNAKGLQFIIDINPENMEIVADKNRFRQIVINLVTNAIEHSNTSEKVIIQGFQNKKNNVIRFIDFGVGIPKKDSKRLFERFEQGNITTGGGTGLGLAIAQWVAQMHKGDIELLDSDKGSIFELTFPKNLS
ncbi:MAG: HAMP domain-containing histidine kinase [Bifidobacteriaceae bacterium]|jgi:signal transduction histidine kinase|nr:HAMP domain-containing histidine kinase [Bifidobacteriaceae bacterium]